MNNTISSDVTIPLSTSSLIRTTAKLSLLDTVNHSDDYEEYDNCYDDGDDTRLLTDQYTVYIPSSEMTLTNDPNFEYPDWSDEPNIPSTESRQQFHKMLHTTLGTHSVNT